jgi:hypothetical protein
VYYKRFASERSSLEERYGTHAGYVCVVTAAANRAVEEGYLLVSDAETLISDAAGSNVLATSLTPTSADIVLANDLCSDPSASGLIAKGRLQQR